jgi:raffinose/stachyose/melibiose transport system substrate-binding protein
MRRFTRKSVLAGTLLLSVVGWAAAQTTLDFWSWRTEDVAAYEQFIDQFQREHPEIAVEFTPYRNTEYNTIVSTALQGGGGPDIVHLRAYGGIEPLAEGGFLVPLDGEIESLAQFDPNIVRGATNRGDGRVYGVPFALQTVQVLYNKALFERLGLEEPQSWDEFVAVAEALEEEGVNALANGAKEPWTLETLFGAVGPSYYGCDGYFDDLIAGKADFTDERFVAALEKMVELQPYMADNFMGVGYTDMQTLFAYEQAGMLIGGSYELGTMAQLNPELEIGSFAFPGETANDPKCISFYVDGSYGINAASPDQEEALEFVSFLASQEFGQMFTDTLKQISAVPGTRPTDPALAEMAEMMDEIGTPYLMLTGFRYGQPSGSTLLQNEVQAVFAGDQTVQEAVDNIQRGVATWYDFGN